MGEHGQQDVPAKRKKRSPEVRREEIMQTALRLFARQGFERTTTKAIAQEAGISEGTIYKYYASKQDLLFAAARSLVTEPVSNIFSGTALPDDEVIISTFLANRLAMWDERSDLIKAIFSEALYNKDFADSFVKATLQPITDIIVSYLIRRMRDGVFRQVDPVITARGLVGHIFSFFLIWGTLYEEEFKTFPREKLVREVTTLFLHGVLKDSSDTNASTGREMT
ncbi:MAG: TetR/AcrR family transcriptional regulator [Armatimonadota bacterium]